MTKIVKKNKEIKKDEVVLKALVFDILYDCYHGIIVYVRIWEGEMFAGQKIKFCQSPNNTYKIETLGVNVPEKLVKKTLMNGEIGWFSANIRDAQQIKKGDTVLNENSDSQQPLFLEYFSKYLDIKPNIFCNLYPSSDSCKFEILRKSIEELQLQDSGLTIDFVESSLLGRGVRCGFVGILQKEVICTRLQKEFDCEVISTFPTISYQIVDKNKKEIKQINNPADFNESDRTKEIRELFLLVEIITPEIYVGKVMKLCSDYRGIFQTQELKINSNYKLTYHLPFAEFVREFHEKIKFVSQGYASLDYQILDFMPSKIVKLEILLNNQPIPDLSYFVHQDAAFERGKKFCEELKSCITPHMFSIVIQARVNGKIIARETLSALKKNVTAKLYGGDRTRKMKLWEKQKTGKKKMKTIGKIKFEADNLTSLLGKISKK